MCIYRSDFNLKETPDALDFLREVYNLVREITVVSSAFNQEKKYLLATICVKAKSVLSFSRQVPETMPGATMMGTIQKEEQANYSTVSTTLFLRPSHCCYLQSDW